MARLLSALGGDANNPKCDGTVGDTSSLGEPSEKNFGFSWDFVPTRGAGVSPNPNFLSKLTKTKFALENGQKCDETHNT